MLLAQLPTNDNYQQLAFSDEQDCFLWQDKQTPLLKIIAPSRTPWGKTWAMKIITERDNSSNKIPVGLTIRCFHPGRGNFLPAMIIRKEFDAQFMLCQEATLHSFAFVLNHANNHNSSEKSWLVYLFKKQGYR